MFIKPPPQENRAQGLPRFPNSVATFLLSLRAGPLIKGGNAANRVKKVKVIQKCYIKRAKLAVTICWRSASHWIRCAHKSATNYQWNPGNGVTVYGTKILQDICCSVLAYLRALRLWTFAHVLVIDSTYSRKHNCIELELFRGTSRFPGVLKGNRVL